MAATTDSFRSSLHGFNRMDVVQFIQKTTSEHELELRRLALSFSSACSNALRIRTAEAAARSRAMRSVCSARR